MSTTDDPKPTLSRPACYTPWNELRAHNAALAAWKKRQEARAVAATSAENAHAAELNTAHAATRKAQEAAELAASRDVAQAQEIARLRGLVATLQAQEKASRNR